MLDRRKTSIPVDPPHGPQIFNNSIPSIFYGPTCIAMQCMVVGLDDKTRRSLWLYISHLRFGFYISFLQTYTRTFPSLLFSRISCLALHGETQIFLFVKQSSLLINYKLLFSEPLQMPGTLARISYRVQ
jgi:hypothetical protein